MKIYSFIIVVFVSLVACENSEVKKNDLAGLVKDSTRFTSIKWIDSLKDIGVVEPGKKTEITFKFKNTGTKPLFIISAQPGCGCTVADYPKEAIAPNGEGIITAAYNVNAGSKGEFRKNIQVTTNTNGSTSHYIFFYGSIKSAADSASSINTDLSTMQALRSKELKRNLLLKPTKN